MFTESHVWHMLYRKEMSCRSFTPAHLLPAVLYEGWFYTDILANRTKVSFKIYNNYAVKATFACQGTAYEFQIKKWAKTRGDVHAATHSFDYFAVLLCAKFRDRSEFETRHVQVDDQGVETVITSRSPAQILNILKYGVLEVFTCAEQIILKYRRSVLDYAIFHREQGKKSTYEEYIHLMACHCLTHANFHAPSIHYPLVDFCSVAQEFQSGGLARIMPAEQDERQED